jgi:ABC-2 type transport system ATP-binding protein
MWNVELRQGLWQFIRRLNRDGHTIVLTTHYLEEAEALCGRIAMLKQGQLVALDTTENLLHRHSGSYVKLRVEPDRLPEALLARVTDNMEGGGYRLSLKNYDELETLMGQLRQSGVKVVELEVVQPDLEEIFVEIMQKA